MSAETTYAWDPQRTPDPLGPLLRALGTEYPITEGRKKGAVVMEFVADANPGELTVQMQDASAVIHYDRPTRAARAVGALLAGLVEPGETYREHLPFETFGIMLDCSRNAVMTVEHLKLWLRRAALLGYNMAMLYTEQTYELPGEDYFGYLRGRYTADELCWIDEYAAALGVEMIGCIQTLGHLEQTLRWPAYHNVRDTDSVLLVDEDATYELIEKMIAHFAKCFGGRRIHVGMDETHDLGRGKFLDRFGYQRGFDIFNRHLGRVVTICKRHGLEPMIWSDMYFRMGSATGAYYEKEAQIPKDVIEKIPSEVQLVYWDYYHEDEQSYLDMIARHKALGSEPIMASGVWTWGRDLWYDHARTQAKVGPCIRACTQAGLKEFFFTLWGDDGAYCQFDSALAGLAWGAELAYRGEDLDEDALARRFAGICGADYQPVIDLAEINTTPQPAPHYQTSDQRSQVKGFARSGPVLWDDPLLGIYYKSCKLGDETFWGRQVEHYCDLLGRVGGYADTTEPIDLAHGVSLLRVLIAKVRVHVELDRAYAARDAVALKRVQQEVPVVIDAIDEVMASFRRQWYRRNKTFGFETIQIRLGALRARYLELAERLGELIAGKIDCIAELDEAPPTAGVAKLNWRNLAGGGIV